MYIFVLDKELRYISTQKITKNVSIRQKNLSHPASFSRRRLGLVLLEW